MSHSHTQALAVVVALFSGLASLPHTLPRHLLSGNLRVTPSPLSLLDSDPRSVTAAPCSLPFAITEKQNRADVIQRLTALPAFT